MWNQWACRLLPEGFAAVSRYIQMDLSFMLNAD